MPYVYDIDHMKNDILSTVQNYSDQMNQGDSAVTEDKLRLDLENEFGYDSEDLKDFNKALDELVAEKKITKSTVDGVDVYSIKPLSREDIENLSKSLNGIDENFDTDQESTTFDLDTVLNDIDTRTDGKFDLYNMYLSLGDVCTYDVKRTIAEKTQNDASDSEIAQQLLTYMSGLEDASIQEAYDDADSLYDIENKAKKDDVKSSTLEEFKSYLHSAIEATQVKVSDEQRANIIRAYLEDEGYQVNLEKTEDLMYPYTVSWVKVED